MEGRKTVIPEASDDHLRAIGRISVNYAYLELLLRGCIWVLLGTDSDRGIVATSELNFRQLTNLVVRLYERPFELPIATLTERDKDRLADFHAMIARVDRAGGDRNAVVHAAWFGMGDLEQRGKALGQKWGRYGRRWYQPDFVQRSARELDQIADRIASVAEEVREFYEPLVIKADLARRPKRSRRPE